MLKTQKITKLSLFFSQVKIPLILSKQEEEKRDFFVYNPEYYIRKNSIPLIRRQYYKGGDNIYLLKLPNCNGDYWTSQLVRRGYQFSNWKYPIIVEASEIHRSLVPYIQNDFTHKKIPVESQENKTIEFAMLNYNLGKYISNNIQKDLRYKFNLPNQLYAYGILFRLYKKLLTPRIQINDRCIETSFAESLCYGNIERSDYVVKSHYSSYWKSAFPPNIHTLITLALKLNIDIKYFFKTIDSLYNRGKITFPYTDSTAFSKKTIDRLLTKYKNDKLIVKNDLFLQKQHQISKDKEGVYVLKTNNKGQNLYIATLIEILSIATLCRYAFIKRTFYDYTFDNGVFLQIVDEQIALEGWLSLFKDYNVFNFELFDSNVLCVNYTKPEYISISEVLPNTLPVEDFFLSALFELEDTSLIVRKKNEISITDLGKCVLEVLSNKFVLDIPSFETISLYKDINLERDTYVIMYCNKEKKNIKHKLLFNGKDFYLKCDICGNYFLLKTFKNTGDFNGILHTFS